MGGEFSTAFSRGRSERCERGLLMTGARTGRVDCTSLVNQLVTRISFGNSLVREYGLLPMVELYVVPSSSSPSSPSRERERANAAMNEQLKTEKEILELTDTEDPLPDRQTQQHLLDLYWSCVHPHFPIVSSTTRACARRRDENRSARACYQKFKLE